jgi:hypothetical protein
MHHREVHNLVLEDETIASDFYDGATLESNDTNDNWGSSNVSKKKKKNGRMATIWEPEPLPGLLAEPGFEPYHQLQDSVGAASTTDFECRSFFGMHAKVFAIASKYDIKPLECTVRRKLKDQTECILDIADLIAAIHVVFNFTPDSEFELRNILKDIMVRHALALVQHPDFEDAVASIDGLAYDLFRLKTYARRGRAM